MSRVVLFTLGFCNSRILGVSWARLYGSLGCKPYEHWFLDNHYPLRREENVRELRSLCLQYGVRWFDSEFDRGLHKSFNNWAFKQGFADDDVLIGLDPDFQAPMSAGWLDAMVEVARQPDVAMAALDIPPLDRWKPGAPNDLPKLEARQTPGGTAYWLHPSIEMWTCAAFRWGFIRRIGGFDEPYEYYGGLESFLFHKWSEVGLRLAYLRDHREPCEPWPAGLIDPEYQAYKHAHLAGFKGSFKQYLEVQS